MGVGGGVATWLVPSAPDSRAVRDQHCVVFLGKKTLNSHGACLHPGVQMGTGEFNVRGNRAMS